MTPSRPATGMRFPLATGAQVRREVGRQIRGVRRARGLFLLALLLLSIGAYAGVLVPQFMGGSSTSSRETGDCRCGRSVRGSSSPR